MCTLGKNCTEDVTNLVDEFIDKQITVTVVQETIKKLNKKQTTMIDMWKQLDSMVKEGEKLEGEWQMVVKDADEALETIRELDAQLYPIRVGNMKPETSIHILEERLSKLPKLKLLPERLAQMIHNVEQVASKLTDAKWEDEHKTILVILKDNQRDLKVGSL